MSWELRQYQNVFDEFCRSVEQDDDLSANIDYKLSVLKRRGNQAGESVSKYIEDGILEVKAKSSGHHARLLFCFQPGRRIYILLCVLKDQRKLKRADIEEAKRRKTIIETLLEIENGNPTRH